jgi:hypothetical protein
MSAKLPKPSKSANEDVLRQITGIFVIPDEPVTQLIHGTPMALDDQIECLAPASETRFDERRFVQRIE